MTDPIDPAGLQAALRKAARRPSTDLDKAPHIARRLLAMPGLADVAAQLATAGIRCLTPMSGDAAAILLDAGTQVVRLSPTAPYHPAGIPELLQADQIGRCGQMTWEILPKAETADITHADVTLMARALEARGLRRTRSGCRQAFRPPPPRRRPRHAARRPPLPVGIPTGAPARLTPPAKRPLRAARTTCSLGGP